MGGLSLLSQTARLLMLSDANDRGSHHRKPIKQQQRRSLSSLLICTARSVLGCQAPSPSTIIKHHHQAPSPSTIIKHHHQAPSPSTITQHHHQAPSPSTITQHHHPAPSPSTITQHRHQAPSPSTIIKNCHPAPSPSTVTKHRHQAPSPSTVTKHHHLAPSPSTVSSQLNPLTGRLWHLLGRSRCVFNKSVWSKRRLSFLPSHSSVSQDRPQCCCTTTLCFWAVCLRACVCVCVCVCGGGVSASRTLQALYNLPLSAAVPVTALMNSYPLGWN